MLFVRSLVGLDRAAAMEAFTNFLENATYSAGQLDFLNLIVEHLTANGTMEDARLHESPFTDRAPTGPGLPVQRPGDQRDCGHPRRHQGASYGSAGQLRHRCLAGLSPQVQLSSTGDVSTLVASITGVSWMMMTSSASSTPSGLGAERGCPPVGTTGGIVGCG